MLYSINRYFFKSIFLSKKKQYLLYLAVFGLFISSFALIVLQSSMGGLQHKLMERNKRIDGNGVIYLPDWNREQVSEVLKIQSLRELRELNEKQVIVEYELEMLVRYENYLAPVIVHGLNIDDVRPDFLSENAFKELVLPMNLALKLNVGVQDELRLISPSHVDQFFGDIPRQMTLKIDSFISTDVPEIDQHHVWVRATSLFNLMRKKIYNRIRVYGDLDFDLLQRELHSRFGEELRLETWEARNQTLVWALNLENSVMIFLFVAMTLLVSLCITSGLMLFFGKVRTELASFWILGSSEAKLEKATQVFINFLSLFSVLLGLASGVIFLLLFDHYGGELMPDVFVDRKIPIYITTRGVLVSFLVPYIVSLVFSFLSFRQFKKDVDYLEFVRSVG